MRKATKRDLDMMKDPRRWPAWPVLPVKRDSNGNYQLGVIIAAKGQLTWVYLCNYWGLVAKTESLKNAKILKYPSLDALLDDGWIVD